MLELFQYLEQNKIYPDTIGDIFDWDDTSLVDFVEECYLKIDHQSEKSNSPFVFTANTALGGGSFPCGHLTCRLTNIRSLSTFTILYADKVLINNPFYDYLDYESFNESLRYQLSNDLYIVYEIKNLLMNGYISFFDPFFHMCKNCYNEFEKKVDEFDKILDELHEYTRNYLLEGSNYKVKYLESGKLSAEINGPKEIFGHDKHYLTFNDAPQLLKGKLLNKDIANLNDQEVIDSGLVDHQTDILINDIVTQHWHNEVYNSSYLTNRSYDFDLLRYIDEYHNRSSKVFDTLSHSIPFLKGVDHLELIKLRHNETESFNVYRDKITEIFQEEKSYTDSEAKDIYNDYLRPELNRIEKALTDNRRSLRSNLSNDVIFCGSVVTIGLSAGLFPPEIGMIIATYGGIDFAKEVFSNFRDLHSDESEIRKNDLYFLWKVQELSN